MTETSLVLQCPQPCPAHSRRSTKAGCRAEAQCAVQSAAAELGAPGGTGRRPLGPIARRERGGLGGRDTSSLLFCSPLRAVRAAEGGGTGEAGVRQRRATPRATAEEAARALLAGAGLRAGAALQAAALPVGSRARPAGQRAEAHVHAGQDLVPEPALQVQAATARPDSGAGGAAPKYFS